MVPKIKIHTCTTLEVNPESSCLGVGSDQKNRKYTAYKSGIARGAKENPNHRGFFVIIFVFDIMIQLTIFGIY